MPIMAELGIDRKPSRVPPAVDLVAKDAILSWFRGEFAAANAIIDALCGHLAELAGFGPGSEYETVFAAIHQRRLNWIPVLQLQKYHSIADVSLELRKVTESKKLHSEVAEVHAKEDAMLEHDSNSLLDSAEEKEPRSGSENEDIVRKVCSNHEDCSNRTKEIKLTKGFHAKEHVKGHLVNVVKGLKLYENIFPDSQLRKLTDFVTELRVSGQNGKLSGETYISFNKEMKGNRRELVQFGSPIFDHISDETSQLAEIEPIPHLIEDVIDHLIEWQMIPEFKRPNGAIIQYFDEDEYSQPFLKPPHLEQPISTLVLSEASMAFGRILAAESDGNFKGPLFLSLSKGSLLVMRGNSADLSRHVMCPSPTRRSCITFFKVRPDTCHRHHSPTYAEAFLMPIWRGTGVFLPPRGSRRNGAP